MKGASVRGIGVAVGALIMNQCPSVPKTPSRGRISHSAQPSGMRAVAGAATVSAMAPMALALKQQRQRIFVTESLRVSADKANSVAEPARRWRRCRCGSTRGGGDEHTGKPMPARHPMRPPRPFTEQEGGKMTTMVGPTKTPWRPRPAANDQSGQKQSVLATSVSPQYLRAQVGRVCELPAAGCKRVAATASVGMR